MNRWLSTTGMAMLLCLIGCGILFLPWASTTVMTVDPIAQADGPYKVKSMANESHPGYRFWHGAASALAFLALFLFLLVTGPLRPVPWWRSAIVLGGAVGIIVVVLVGMNYRHRALGQSDFGARRLVLGGLGLMNHVAIGLAAGLTLLAALEMRSRVAGSRPERGQGAAKPLGAGGAEPSAAPDPARM